MAGEELAGEKENEPWFALEPLPPLDQILPEHIAYVRSVVARFSVTPTHWREDLVQEILIEAHRSRESRLDVRALLFGITRHVVFRWMAKRDAERTAVALHLGRDPVTSRSAEDDWQEAERREAVRASIDELPEIFREVFVRSEIEHMTMPEVAKALGIPVNTGYTRLHLARARFLESLQRLLARRRIQKEDLTPPVVIGAAAALEPEAGPEPRPEPAPEPAPAPSVGKAGVTTNAGGLGASAPWIAGSLVAAAAVVIGVWIARSPEATQPDTSVTAEPSSTAQTSPGVTTDTSADPSASTASPAIPDVSAKPPSPVPGSSAAQPAPTDTEGPNEPAAQDPGHPDTGKEEGLAARAVMGLIKAGRRDDAIKAAEEFRRSYPKSVYNTNIAQLLATPPPPAAAEGDGR